MDESGVRGVFAQVLKTYTNKPIEEIDFSVETLASLGIDFDRFANQVVVAIRRPLIVHSYSEDTLQTILGRTF